MNGLGMFAGLVFVLMTHAAFATIEKAPLQNRVAAGSINALGIALASYEGYRVGYTLDQGDDGYMDFTLSPLVIFCRKKDIDERPVAPGWAWGPDGKYRVAGIVAVNLRAGQYIITRDSSPVVGKRFNPLFGVRLSKPVASPMTGLHFKYVDVTYAHESNGASISTLEQFQDQLKVYQRVESDQTKAFRRARDDISRGWDYYGFDSYFDNVGAEEEAPGGHFLHAIRAGLHIYTRKGFAQGTAEEYSAWEPGPVGGPRRYYDGVNLKYQISFKNNSKYDLSGQWTTGYSKLARYNTWTTEAGYTPVPGIRLLAKFRYGYNSDLVDYYKKDHTLSFAVSFGD